MITLDIHTPLNEVLAESQVPDDYVTEEIINELVAILEYPKFNASGEAISYSLALLRTGAPLASGQRLSEAGIVDGDAIELIASEDITLLLNAPTRLSPEETRPSASQRLKVFLCHSSSDKLPVRVLYHRLQADGFDPWLDEESLVPGQDWNREIIKAVGASHVVLVCLSNKSVNKSGYVQKEIKFALDTADEQPEDTIFLIPLRLEDCKVPTRLRRWHWVNLYEDNGYKRLLRALELRAVALGITPNS